MKYHTQDLFQTHILGPLLTIMKIKSCACTQIFWISDHMHLSTSIYTQRHTYIRYISSLWSKWVEQNMVFFLFFFWFTFPFPFCYSFSPPACFLQPQCKEVLKHTLNNVKLFSIQREYILVHECMFLNTQNFTFSSSLPAPLFRSPLPTTGIVLHSIFPTKPCDGFAVTWKYGLPPTHCSSLNIQLDNYKNRPRL